LRFLDLVSVFFCVCSFPSRFVFFLRSRLRYVCVRSVPFCSFTFLFFAVRLSFQSVHVFLRFTFAFFCTFYVVWILRLRYSTFCSFWILSFRFTVDLRLRSFYFGAVVLRSHLLRSRCGYVRYRSGYVSCLRSRSRSRLHSSFHAFCSVWFCVPLLDFAVVVRIFFFSLRSGAFWITCSRFYILRFLISGVCSRLRLRSRFTFLPRSFAFPFRFCCSISPFYDSLTFVVAFCSSLFLSLIFFDFFIFRFSSFWIVFFAFLPVLFVVVRFLFLHWSHFCTLLFCCSSPFYHSHSYDFFLFVTFVRFRFILSLVLFVVVVRCFVTFVRFIFPLHSTLFVPLVLFCLRCSVAILRLPFLRFFFYDSLFYILSSIFIFTIRFCPSLIPLSSRFYVVTAFTVRYVPFARCLRYIRSIVRWITLRLFPFTLNFFFHVFYVYVTFDRYLFGYCFASFCILRLRSIQFTSSHRFCTLFVSFCVDLFVVRLIVQILHVLFVLILIDFARFFPFLLISFFYVLIYRLRFWLIFARLFDLFFVSPHVPFIPLPTRSRWFCLRFFFAFDHSRCSRSRLSTIRLVCVDLIDPSCFFRCVYVLFSFVRSYRFHFFFLVRSFWFLPTRFPSRSVCCFFFLRFAYPLRLHSISMFTFYVVPWLIRLRCRYSFFFVVFFAFLTFRSLRCCYRSFDIFFAIPFVYVCYLSALIRCSIDFLFVVRYSAIPPRPCFVTLLLHSDVRYVISLLHSIPSCISGEILFICSFCCCCWCCCCCCYSKILIHFVILHIHFILPVLLLVHVLRWLSRSPFTWSPVPPPVFFFFFDFSAISPIRFFFFRSFYVRFFRFLFVLRYVQADPLFWTRLFVLPFFPARFRSDLFSVLTCSHHVSTFSTSSLRFLPHPLLGAFLNRSFSPPVEYPAIFSFGAFSRFVPFLIANSLT